MTRLRSPKMKQGPERHTPSGPHSFVLIPDMFTKLSQGDVPVGVGVQLHSGGVARLVLIKALTADHGGIVPAVLQLREVQPVPAPGAGRLEIRPDPPVGGHASATATWP